MLNYFKGQTILMCAAAVAIPLVVMFVWSVAAGQAMGFTIQGTVVSIVLLLGSMFVLANVFERRALSKAERWVSLYNDGCRLVDFLEQGKKLADSVLSSGAANEQGAWYLSTYALALADAGRKSEAAQAGLFLQRAVRDARKPSAKSAIMTDLEPLVERLFGCERALALIDEALAEPPAAGDGQDHLRRGFLLWARDVAQAEVSGNDEALLARCREVRLGSLYGMRMRVEFALREADIHRRLGNAPQEAECLRFAVENGGDLPAARRALERLAQAGAC